MFRWIGVLVLCVLAAGCVDLRPDRLGVLPLGGEADYDRVLAQTKLISDPHVGWSQVSGPIVTDFGFGTSVGYMAGVKVKGDEVAFGIVVEGFFPKRVYLGDVYSQGRKLRSKVIDRERLHCGSGCTTAETVLIDVTQAEFEDYAANGLTFEVTGRRNSITVSIPASYFAAVLASYREHFARGAE